jgi:hypothetical protein
MFVPQSGVVLVGAVALSVVLLIAAGLAHLGRNTHEMDHRWSPAAAGALTALFVVCLAFMYGSVSSPYLYFQF